MNDYFEFKKKIHELVKAWNNVIKPGIKESGQYGETNTRKYLIDPILDALNWVDDGSKKIIDNEFSVKHKTGTGSADYALKVNGIPKILVEAKDVAKIKDLENGYDTVLGFKRTYPRQLSNYCHDLNHQGFDIKFSILTNGKEWIVYNMKYADISSEREIIFILNLEELDKDENIKKLWALEYRDICGDYHRLREIIQQLHDFRLDIDKKAVQQLLECKELLSNSIFNDYEKNKRGIKDQIDDILQDKEQVNGMPIFQELPEEERLNYFIKEASSSVINKILFIRILEDKNFLKPKLTKRKIEEWRDFFGYKDYDEIMNLFRESCRISEKTYNGGLFRLNPYDKVEYNPNIIKKIIDILGDINFREIGSDIIGRIYEIYLGQVLKVESEIRGKKRTKYQTDNKERKKLGQYYTPKFVVDFIVRNTLGKLIEGKKPEEISKIRILDPACGSGSFLINTYDVLTEYFENWNNEILKKIELRNRKNGAKITNYSDTGAVPKFKNIILKDNLHGVDLNDLSVQICEINLWLRALERDKKLIKLNKNILHGNSLITGVENKEELSKFKNELEDIKKRQNQIKEYYDEDEIPHSEEKRLEALERNLKFIKNNINENLNENLKDYFGDNLNFIHPFNWEVEFPEVLQEEGFNIIIGNPPYVSVKALPKIEKDYFINYYYSAIGQFDLYGLFIERSINLLKEGGYFGFITSNTFLENKDFKKLREFILKNTKIKKIIDLRETVFKDANLDVSILILEKCSNELKRNKNTIFAIDSPKKFENKDFVEIPQSNFLKQNNFKFKIHFDKKVEKILSRLSDEIIPLGSIPIKMTRGIERGSNECIESFDHPGNSYVPILVGKDISKYNITFRNRYVKYDASNKSDYKSRDIFETPKILIQRIRNLSLKRRLVATLDYDNYYTMNTLRIILQDNPDYDLKYLLALINSKLINYYFLKSFNNKDIYAYQLEQIPIKKINKLNQELISNISSKAGLILYLNRLNKKMTREFTKILSNQPITDPKDCNFGRYFDNYDLYGIQRETFNKINEIKAKLQSIDIRADGQKIMIFATIYDESKNQLKENIKAIELTVENEDVRKFLFLSLKKAIDEKGGKGFGIRNILNIIKKIYVPFYVTNAKMNIEKIKEVMKEFNHNTKDLWWKSEDKKDKFNSLTEVEEKIEKTDREIDDLVYELYDLTEEERKIIEDSLV